MPKSSLAREPGDLPSTAQLQLLFARLNAQHFGGVLRSHRIVYNRRLTTVAGRIAYRPRVIELASSLLSAQPSHVEATLLHEMVHAWLHERGLPSGHSSHFKRKMREVGLASIYHYLPVRGRRRSRRRYLLTCPRCKAQIWRSRRPGWRVSCARCFPSRFNPRVELSVRRIA
jgi:predicted SprT family Zn-dependent metalloprotease